MTFMRLIITVKKFAISFRIPLTFLQIFSRIKNKEEELSFTLIFARNRETQQCEFDFLQNSFKTVKFVESFCEKWQNNPSGNSHILLKNTQTQNYFLP